MSIHALLPDGTTLLSLQPEELAGLLLQFLNSLPEYQKNKLNRLNFFLEDIAVSGYPNELLDDIRRALMEAWVWLENEGFLAPRPASQGSWVFITRRGKQMLSAEQVAAYRQANLLPRQLLHGRIAAKVWSTFIRGEYDTAVFQAFKEVEVMVRAAAGLPDSEIGTSLMRRAFNTDGPLADKTALTAEREALAHLFVGAIGSYKNPHSHRSVKIDAVQAVEMIILASHLLGIVDKRGST